MLENLFVQTLSVSVQTALLLLPLFFSPIDGLQGNFPPRQDAFMVGV